MMTEPKNTLTLTNDGKVTDRGELNMEGKK